MKRLRNRTLVRTDANGNTVAVDLKLVGPAFFSNFQFIVTDDELELVVGVLEDKIAYLLGDRVIVSGDIMGYISPGIRKPGFGTIVGIRDDYTDHFYVVRMDNGEEGSVKSARIQVVD